ncbi:MAG: WD40 repeat domain-containing protein, partial [Muribaculaceae bacterium]|nr:WD40 repeat domain-containing protein [Muribaculaceae bacterium]
MSLRHLSATVALALVAALSVQSAAQTRNEYDFRMKSKPEIMRRYSTTLYTSNNKDVNNVQSTNLATLPQPVADFQVSPAGIYFMALTQGNKPSQAFLYDIRDVDVLINKFNNKAYGVPTAVGFTPDAKYLLLATNKGIHQIEPVKFHIIKTIPTEFQPTEILMSTDGYYLAATDGHKVVVYNFEESKPRKTWNIDEKVTSMAFSPDNSQFAILTDDGVLNIYDTRSFGLKLDVDELGDGIDFDFNLDGKYVAVITSPKTIQIVNLLRPDERETITVDDEAGASMLCFLPDSRQNTLLAYTQGSGIHAKRMHGLEPYYG